MRTLTTRLAAVIAILLGGAGATAAQSADEIIEKSIAAMGGRAAFDKITSRLMTGKASISTPQGDIPATFEQLLAAPNKGGS